MNELEKVTAQNEELMKIVQDYKGQCEYLRAELDEYKSISDSPSEIRRQIAESVKLLSDYNQLGAIDELRHKLESLEAYEALGTTESIQESVNQNSMYSDIGSTEELSMFKALKLTVESLKSSKEDASIEDKVNIANDILKSVSESKTDSLEGFREIVKSMLGLTESLSVEEIKQVVETISEYGLKGKSDTESFLNTLAKVCEEGISDDVLREYHMYKTMGTVGEVRQATRLLEEISNIGTIDEIKAAYNVLDEISEIGTVSEIKETYNTLSEISEIGTISEIKEAYNVLEALSKKATLAEIDEATNILRNISRLGSLEDIESAVQYTKAQYAKLVESQKKDIAEAYNLSESVVGKLFNDFNNNAEAVVEHISMFKPRVNTAKKVILTAAEPVSTPVNESVKREKYENFLKLVK